MKNYDKNKTSLYLKYWDNVAKPYSKYFERIKDTSQFNEDFIRNYNEESDEGYFL